MNDIPCKVCGGPVRIRTSKTLAPGYRSLYVQCKDPNCAERFKVEDIKETLTEAEQVERSGIKRLDLAASALVIVDQQVCMRDRGPDERNNHDAETQIQELLNIWRQHKLAIAHVRHISRDPSSGFAPGQSGVKFQPEFEPLDHEAVFDKGVPDAFINTGLEKWLKVRGTQHVVICGVSSENSVENTARTAGNLGFCVWVPEAACYTFAKKDYSHTHRTAAEVHAMAMANLCNEYASVVSREWLQLAIAFWQKK